MKKALITILTVATILFGAAFGVMSIGNANAGFNKQVFDFNYDFKYAVLTRYDGEQLIPIQSWTDFEDGDQIQFTSTDGITYLVHSSNVILLSDLENTTTK